MTTATMETHQGINRQRLFILSCVALTVTSMTFAIRAGMLNNLGSDFGLNKEQLGWIASMAFFGFPAATVLGGLLYNYLGPKKIMYLAFLGHMIGLIMTIFSGGFWGLMISTFFVGFANGSVEAGANPLIADLYHENKTTMLNKFHVWFPGGLVIGGLLSLAIKHFFGSSGSTWQLEIAVIIIPTLIYGWLVFTTKFPDIQEDTTLKTDTWENLKSLINPLFIFMCVLMVFTATTELGPNQMIAVLLQQTESSGLMALVLISTIMAFGRYFAGPLVHAINPVGVLLFSAIVATIGMYLFSIADGQMVYVAAVVFAVGICYFWPTMVGFVSEYLPQTGALGLSVIGGAGMLGSGLIIPIIGGWLDAEEARLAAAGLAEDVVKADAGQNVIIDHIIFFPLIALTFCLLLFAMRKQIASGGNHD